MSSAAEFDRTLRVVIWCDAFLSAAAAVLAVVVSPLVAVLGLPRSALTAVGVAVLASAAVLAACGAVTAVLLARRMVHRQYLMPPALRIPLPAAMVPDFSEPDFAPEPPVIARAGAG